MILRHAGAGRAAARPASSMQHARSCVTWRATRSSEEGGISPFRTHTHAHTHAQLDRHGRLHTGGATDHGRPHTDEATQRARPRRRGACAHAWVLALLVVLGFSVFTRVTAAAGAQSSGPPVYEEDLDTGETIEITEESTAHAGDHEMLDAAGAGEHVEEEELPEDPFDLAVEELREQVGLSCPAALLRAPEEMITDVKEHSGAAGIVDDEEEDEAVLSHLFPWLSDMLRPWMSSWTSDTHKPDSTSTSARSPLHSLALLARSGDLRSIVCLAELRLFSASKRIAPDWFLDLPVVAFAYSQETAMCIDEIAVATSQSARCAADTAIAPQSINLQFSTVADAVTALAVAACIGKEKAMLVVSRALGVPDSASGIAAPHLLEAQVDAEFAAARFSSSASVTGSAVALDRLRQTLMHRESMLLTLANVDMAATSARSNAALRVGTMFTAPYALHQVDNSIYEANTTVNWSLLPSRWHGLSHIIATVDVALRVDLALPSWDAVSAHQEATVLLALLHLVRFRVEPDGFHRAIGAKCSAWQPQQLLPADANLIRVPSVKSWRDTLSGAVNSVVQAAGALAGRPPRNATAASTLLWSDYAAGFATLFPSDTIALDTLATMARAGVQVAGVAIAQHWLRTLGGPEDTVGRASHTTDALCMRAVEVLLPIVQDTVSDSSVTAAMHPESSFPQLWEAHEDAFVATAAKDTALNVEMLREEADVQDIPDAQVELGELLVYGYPQADIAADPIAARRFFERAAAAGHAGAMAQLGMMLLDGVGEKNTTRALELLEEAGRHGSPHALAGLGYMYETGTGVPRNLSKAVEYLKQAAAAGAVNAHNNLGALYLMGNQEDPARDGPDGVPFNATAAREHLEVAHQHGFAPATFNLGLIEYQGWASGGASNCSGAATYWMDVALRSRWLDFSLFAPGTAFDAFKSGSDSDVRVAARQYLLLAQMGLRSAQDNTGFLLEHSHLATGVVDAFFAADPAADAQQRDIWSRRITCIACSVLAVSTRRRMLDASTAGHGGAESPDVGLDLTGSAVRQADFRPHADVVHANPRRIAHAWYARAAAAEHPHALKALGDCLADQWAGVPACDPQINSTLLGVHENSSLTVAAQQAISSLERSAQLGFGHAYFALSHAYATGFCGQLRVPRNISQAWEYLDYCLDVDALSDWPVLFARVGVVLEWAVAEVSQMVNVALPDNSRESVMRTSALADLWECLVTYPDDVPEANEEPAGHAPSTPRSPLSSSVVQQAAEEEDLFALGYGVSDTRLPRGAARFHVGPLPLSVHDRQLCTVVTRALVACVALVLAAIVVIIGCACTRRDDAATQLEHVRPAEAAPGRGAAPR